ncbi:MutS-like protein [Clavispora lusitaniae]|nr:MutS-like protein [Clavispora lusitaniae]
MLGLSWRESPILTDAEAIENRHSLVGHMINDTNLRVFVSQEWLPQVPDVKRLLKKMATGLKKPAASENKKLEEVVRLYQLITSLPNLLNMLQIWW